MGRLSTLEAQLRAELQERLEALQEEARRIESALEALGPAAASAKAAASRGRALAPRARARRTAVLDDSLTVKDLLRVDVLELSDERLEQLRHGTRPARAVT